MHQLAVPPYTFTCPQCGNTWDPLPPKHGRPVTAGYLDRLAKDHFKQCRPRLVDKGMPPADQDGRHHGSD